MAHFLHFLWSLPVLLATGLPPAQAQCPRSAQSRCSPPTKAKVDHISQAGAAARRATLLRVGVGASLNGSGDYLIARTHLEYAPQLGRHWRLGSRLAYTGGSKPLNLDYGDGYTIPQSYRAVNVEQEIHWLPFGAGRLLEVGLGGGAFAGYSRLIGFSQLGYTAAAGTANGVPRFDYTPRREQGLQVGYIASLYADYALNQDRTWRLGGRLALQNDTRANILPGGQLQLSRSL